MWRPGRGPRVHLPQVPQKGAVAAPESQARRNRPPASGIRGPTARRRGRTLTVTIPLVGLVAVFAFVAWRFMGLRMSQLILCLLLGFLLAATSAAPENNN